VLNVDLRRAARSHSERIAVVEAVADSAAHEPETDWIEWKSNLDISTTEGSFSVARSILGFGNRDPGYAARFARGCAYFLVGVEPGNVFGTQPHDPANTEQWFRRFIAPGEPQWSVDYLDVRGKTVMLVTVEAPQWGDEIFTLQKGFEKAKAGDVFVRLNGKTEYATPADIRRLTERAKRADLRLNVTVDWRRPTQLRAVASSAAKARAWAKRDLERLRPREWPRRNPYDVTALMSRDRRKPDEFTNEMRQYAAQAPTRYQLLARKGAVDVRLAPLALVVENPTEINFAKTQVTLRLPADVFAYFGSHEIDNQLDECRPPLEWGQDTIYHLDTPRIHNLLGAFRPDGRKVDSDGGELVVTLPPVDVRPRTKHELEPVYLAVPDSYVGKALEIAWRATSTSAAGDASGSLEAEVVDAVDADALVEAAAAEDRPAVAD
jgi:hypothetical protein